MYGGDKPSAHFAMKVLSLSLSFCVYIEDTQAARHELKSLTALYNTGITQVNLPLLAIITYRGFSLICISKVLAIHKFFLSVSLSITLPKFMHPLLPLLLHTSVHR
jgi:hypothetical protein